MKRYCRFGLAAFWIPTARALRRMRPSRSSAHILDSWRRLRHRGPARNTPERVEQPDDVLGAHRSVSMLSPPFRCRAPSVEKTVARPCDYQGDIRSEVLLETLVSLSPHRVRGGHTQESGDLRQCQFTAFAGDLTPTLCGDRDLGLRDHRTPSTELLVPFILRLCEDGVGVFVPLGLGRVEEI